MATGSSSPRRPLRRIRALQRALVKADAELVFRTTEEDDDREEENDRRKFLVGHVVLEQVQREPELIPELRSQLKVGLTRAYDRTLFQLDAGGPLIPQEEWPGWPERDDTLAAGPYTRLTPGRRQARITFLQDSRKDILQELEALLKKDAPKRENNAKQRKIVVGAVLLKRAFREQEEMNRLRKLLDNGLTAQRDRGLFQLDGVGPLIPEELWRASLDTKAPAAKMRDSDNAPPAADTHAQSPRSDSQHPDRSGRAESPQAGAVRSREPDSAGNEATSPDAQEPIAGWRPCRIRVQNGSDSEAGRQETEWGARLTGQKVIAALPTELRGKRITVTDSSEDSWVTTITEVESRDEKSITVRNSGRPGREGKPSRRSRTSGSSST